MSPSGTNGSKHISFEQVNGAKKTGHASGSPSKKHGSSPSRGSGSKASILARKAGTTLPSLSTSAAASGSAVNAPSTGLESEPEFVSPMDNFARTITTMSVAHIARGVGFDVVQRSALDTMADLVAKYLHQIGSSSKEVAELAGRTQPRITDVLQALRDLTPAPVEATELIQALETAKRPFPRDVPAFPVRKRDHSGNLRLLENSQIGNREPLPSHVPKFLPPLPSRHTYSSKSQEVVERTHDSKRTRLELLNQKSQVQQALHSIDQVLAPRESTAALAMSSSQPAWSVLQPSQALGANAFSQPAKVISSASSSSSDKKRQLYQGFERDFAPVPSAARSKKKDALGGSSLGSSSVGTSSVASSLGSKTSNNQDLGKEDKILNGTFHDGDSE